MLIIRNTSKSKSGLKSLKTTGRAKIYWAKIYQANVNKKKVGIVLPGLIPESEVLNTTNTTNTAYRASVMVHVSMCA